MIMLFQNILLLVYIAKLKRGLGLAFGAHFLHDFSIKMFLIWYSYNELNFNFTTISFLWYQTKCVIKFLLTQLMANLKIFFGSTAEAVADREREEDKNTKTWISREQKELLRWNKKYFSYFLNGYHFVINKNLIKNSGYKL